MHISASVALTQELIARASVTPSDNGCQDLMIQRLARAGFVRGSAVVEENNGQKFVRWRLAEPNAAFRGVAGILRRDFGEVGFIQFEIEQAIAEGAAQRNFDGIDERPALRKLFIRFQGGEFAWLPGGEREGATAWGASEAAVRARLRVNQRIDLSSCK